MIDGYANTNIRRWVVTYWTAGLGLVLGFAATRSATRASDAQLHAVMEAVSTWLALVGGTMPLMRFCTGKYNAFLIVGTGFLGAAR